MCPQTHTLKGVGFIFNDNFWMEFSLGPVSILPPPTPNPPRPGLRPPLSALIPEDLREVAHSNGWAHFTWPSNECFYVSCDLSVAFDTVKHAPLWTPRPPLV